ncbi:hypothetical protein Acor_40200 [Acrocarpospora corrugata]|uniref:DUF6286 domain-containing protein n=1 Tax=Acrocarpospora corrugata TaxID=35763 RepID=A0A5M3VYS1_9ACTN|nr:DUF6286 domain-containing protein [Acrocarpospora corrugata]GES01955.1 hypothetical protein Acor_40200 [Acrocarpospora corrugata]
MSTVEEILTAVPGKRVRRRLVARRATRTLHPGRTVAGIAVAAVVAITALGIMAEMVAFWWGAHSLWPGVSGALALTWRDPLVPGLALAAVAAGLALVALALLPGRAKLVALETVDESVTMGLTRSGLCRTLAAAALAVDGADLARVRLRHGRIQVTVVTDAFRTGDLLREVGAAVGDRLQGLALHGRHEVVVRLRRRKI